MHVVVVYKSDPAYSPPVISACRWLRAVGCDVSLVSVDPSADVTTELESAGVNLHVIPGSTQIKANPLTRVTRLLRFATTAWRYIENVVSPGAVLWISGLETAVALGSRLLNRPFVLHLHELYDREWRFRIFLRRIVQHAALVVVPEPNRAALIRYWYQPKAPVMVIPNKAFCSRQQIAAMLLSDTGINWQELQSLFNDRKVLLYQGLIDLKERDLLPVARAVHCLRDEWRLVLMGHDLRSITTIQRECPSAVHLPFIPPPHHLKVTELAYAGAVSYSWRSLNGVYCAPNKIWEYALCRKPMLCNDVPGLVETVERHQAGICVDFGDEDALSQALRRLSEEYADFVRGTARLYESFDAGEAYRRVLDILTAHKIGPFAAAAR